MTKKDIPYVALLVIFMVTTFFAGRLSVSSQAQQAPNSTLASDIFTAPTSVTDRAVDRGKVIHVEALPPTLTAQALPPMLTAEALSEKRLSKPGLDVVAVPMTPVGAKVAPVPPMKIELEDDPAAVANPYRPKPVASTPGF